ncbi:hypothetical protein ACIQZO_20645 [Streptomyces sp. NPDC097617]|uniref:hypothetical protein n=1 Tax=Streptomyces sp. NPDC097617 TaxID=3366091 RepID=UPI003818BC11
MHFVSEQRLDDGVLEREFTLGEIPGTLWTPESAPPVPLILMSHNNGLPKADPRLVARARYTAARGFAVATIDAVGCGDRPRSAAAEQARAEFRRAMQTGGPVDEVFESFIGPLVENAVPDWRTTLDALLELPEIGGPAAARIDAGKVEDVTDEGTVRLGVLAVEDDMRTADHGWLRSIDVPTVVSPASWHAKVKKIFDWVR